MQFSEELNEQPSDEVSQKKGADAFGGDDLPDRDITDREWALQYVDSNKKVVLLTARTKGVGQLAKERPLVTEKIRERGNGVREGEG